MQYVSTRGQVEPIGFADAVIMGLAEDGGLLVPQGIPDAGDRLDDWAGLSYNELAVEIFKLFVDDIPADDLKRLVEASYAGNFQPELAPVVNVGPLHVLELFHGPTLAFKDVALQLLGNLFEYILERRDGRLNILAATSGDTGSAAIYGVRGRDHIEIFVMHPHNGISPIQQRQMTTVLDPNVHNLAVNGSFDDCQRIMKTLAADLDFKRKYHLGAVNSVNWARVLAQIVYYFHGVLRLMRSTGASSVRVAVPTGNFGDILAGWYARQMGLPISKLILATNENDILTRFFNTGSYAVGDVVKSLAPAMDIQVASNFERYLYYRLGEDPHRLRELMESFAQSGSLEVMASEAGVDADFAAGRAGREETLETIGRFHRDHGYLLDPHTAVGVCVALRQAETSEPILSLATAHPAKFPDAIRQATGADLAHHPDIDALADLPTRCQEVDGQVEAVRDFVVRTLDARMLSGSE
jgi:threonine synthase